jgi:murein DD-endopeptidase MepM/ murein hydrolase activator NlpD
LSGALIFSFFLVPVEKANAGFFGDVLSIFLNTDKTKANISDITVESWDTMAESNEDEPIIGTQEISALQGGPGGMGMPGDIRMTNESSAIQSSPPSLTDDAGSQFASKKIITYIVKEGDTLYSIADKFDITLETLVWANEGAVGSKGNYIKLGAELIIPPMDGVVHTVVKGDTIAKIAKLYMPGKDQQPQQQAYETPDDFAKDIADYNGIEGGGNLEIGLRLMVPYGQRKVFSKPIPKPKVIAESGLKKGNTPRMLTGGQVIVNSDWLIAPTSGYNQKRRHANNGDDISNPCGTPIYAAAQGVAVQVNITNSKSKWANGGYGNNVRIQHKNGAITLYAHLQATYVKQGEAVNQGDLIGLMGGRPGTPGAGRTTGCHLHFEIRGATNPFLK